MEKEEEKLTEEEKRAFEFSEEICTILRENSVKVRIREFDPAKQGGLKPGEIVLTLRVGRKMSNKERGLNKTKYAGDSPNDIKLWNTYVYWALEKARFGQAKDKTTTQAIVDDPDNRIKDDISLALQIIIFSAFALEYRLKRVLIDRGVKGKSNGNLDPLLDIFWKELKKRNRWDKKGKCFKPTGWDNCEEDLRKLVKLRNKIVHANYLETLSFFSGKENSLKTALRYYHSFIKAMGLISIGTGYGVLSNEEVEKELEALLVW